MASKISQHNKVINQSNPKENAGCNGRNPNECPIPGDCLATNVVYQALLDSETGYFNYFRLAANTFKERYRNQKHDLKDRERERERERERAREQLCQIKFGSSGMLTRSSQLSRA